MLPDLRIVIAAVVSTFILTVGVGFFASSRLINEQLTAHVDAKDDTPINRIALNWPEPTKFEPSIDLDFAISAKVAKNPVRDITPAPDQARPAQSNETAAPAAAIDQTKETAPPAETPAPVVQAPAAPEAPANNAAAVTAPQTSETAAQKPAEPDTTGSVATPAPPPEPQAPVSRPHQQMAARTEETHKEHETSKAAVTVPAKALTVRKKRPIKTVKKPRTVAVRPQPAPVPFDFFGLFRSQTLRPLLQTETPFSSPI